MASDNLDRIDMERLPEAVDILTWFIQDYDRKEK
jgi:hypothetical protein